MNGHDWADDYEAAIGKFERFIVQADDGTLRLNVDDPRDIGIDDPVLFADLRRSLEETNKKIDRGELSAGGVLTRTR